VSPFFWTTYALLWFVVAFALVAILLMYRQFGLVYMSSRRRLDLQGPDVGAKAPSVRVTRIPSFEETSIDWTSNDRDASGVFALFALATCDVCKSLLSQVGPLAREWPELGFLWIHGSTESAADAIASAPELPSWSVLAGAGMEAHQVFDVGAVPFGFVIGSDGAVRSKGLINEVDDIARLIERAQIVGFTREQERSYS